MRASLPVAAAALLGVATVLGFAPFGLSALPVFTLAGLFLLWRHARSPRAAAAALGSISFGLPLAVVDGNVIRVMARLLARSTMAAMIAPLARSPR